MKRAIRWLAGTAAVIGVIAIGLWQFGAGLPGLLSSLRNPVEAYHPVVWQKGPAVLPAISSRPPPGRPPPDRPPNVILIVADDLGFNDISLNGGGVAGGLVKTPNIDSIGHDGVTFTTAYAGNATCSPSRAALMTGRYPTRYGFEFTAVPGAFARVVGHAGGDSPVPVIYHGELNHDLIDYPEMGVPSSEVTIADVLRQRGYHTIHLGKWHLGEADRIAPHGHGFDESLGFRAGGSKYLHQRDPDVVNAKLPWDPIDKFLWPNLPYAVQYNNGQRFEPNEHMTDYLTDNAIEAIEANRNRPFFMYLAYNAPHTPLQATTADYNALSMIGDHKTRVYAAMVRQLDRRIGDVLAKLRTLGLDKNTLVIFTSDNGGAWYTGIPDLNKPYRGWKATFFEGGIRVPMLMRWPGHIAAGTRSPTWASHLDIFSTVAAVTGAKMPADRVMDSVDILSGVVPGLPPAMRTAPFFWRSGDYRVVRDGDWKLQVSGRLRKMWLYNLATDPTEQSNLVDQQPAKVAQLQSKIAAHNARMAKPLWPGLIEAPIRIDVPLNAPWSNNQDYIYWTN